MRSIGITLAIVLFSTWMSAGAYCSGRVSDERPEVSAESPADVPANDAEKTPSVGEKAMVFKPIADLTTNIAPSKGALPQEHPMVATAFQPRAFAPFTYTWVAPGLCHKPLYFEDVGLDAHGHTCCPLLQPIVSGACFFTTIVVLPYEMGVELPCEDIYALGYYRPGSCAPYILDPIPLSVRGAVFEAGAVVGGVFAFP